MNLLEEIKVSLQNNPNLNQEIKIKMLGLVNIYYFFII